MKQFILVIEGPICSGKSSAADLLLSRHENLFHVSYDKIKWLISHYSSQKYHQLVTQLTYELGKAALAKGFSLVVNGAILKKTQEKYKMLAAKNKINFFEVVLDAPMPVLKARFKKRVASARRAKSKISATTLADMMRVYNRYQENKSLKVVTFDSSKLSTKQIVSKIEKLLAI